MATQAADDDFGETLTSRGASALAVENSSDRGVVIVNRKPLDQCDRVLVGADRGLRLGQRHCELGERAAAPAKCDSCTPLFTVDVEDRFFDQAAQQLLAVAVGGGRCRPHSPEVRTECQQLLTFLGGERARALALAQGKLGLGLGERAKRALPVALKAPGNQAVLGLDLAVAALGALCLIARPLDLQVPLRQRGVVVGLERLGRAQRSLHAGGGECLNEGGGDRLLDRACRPL